MSDEGITPYSACPTAARPSSGMPPRWARVVVEPVVMDDGRAGHCELAVGDARWVMSDEFPEAGVASPSPDRGAAVTLHPAVADVDRAASQVVATGTALTRGPEDAGEVGRVATFVDPFGHRWFLDSPA